MSPSEELFDPRLSGSQNSKKRSASSNGTPFEETHLPTLLSYYGSEIIRFATINRSNNYADKSSTILFANEQTKLTSNNNNQCFKMCSVDEIVTSPLSPRFPCHVLRTNIWAIGDHMLSIEKPATRSPCRQKVSPPKSNQTTDSQDDCKTQRIAKVKFETVLEVRSYNTVLGDNPSVGQGPPVSLGWQYTTRKELMADSDNHQKLLPIAYQLDALSRRDRLQQNGFSKQEMDDAVVEMDIIKRFRLIRTSTIIAVNRTSSTSRETTTKRVGSLTWAATPTKRSRRAAPRTRINTPYPRPRSMTLPCH